jgi:hypothetical protein
MKNLKVGLMLGLLVFGQGLMADKDKSDDNIISQITRCCTELDQEIKRSCRQMDQKNVEKAADQLVYGVTLGCVNLEENSDVHSKDDSFKAYFDNQIKGVSSVMTCSVLTILLSQAAEFNISLKDAGVGCTSALAALAMNDARKSNLKKSN